MNPIVLSFVFCLAAQGAFAGYQSSGYGAQQMGYNQRKLAPTPQTYGAAAAVASSNNGYGQQQQEQYGEMNSYEQPQQQSYAPARSSYGKQAAPVASYGQQQSAGYGKSAARYEEPSYPPMPFAWGYDINDGYGGAQYHKESGDEYGKRTGSYGYTDAYGVYRQVDYVADEHGFRATIKTNEPGTANESPADVELHAYEPPSNYYAGNQQSYGKAASSGNSYGAATSSYSQAPVAQSSYGQQQQSGYSAAPARSSGYGQQQAGYGQQARGYKQQSNGYSAPRQQYNEQAQYSSSQVMPVYQKAAIKPVVAAKKY